MIITESSFVWSIEATWQKLCGALTACVRPYSHLHSRISGGRAAAQGSETCKTKNPRLQKKHQRRRTHNSSSYPLPSVCSVLAFAPTYYDPLVSWLTMTSLRFHLTALLVSALVRRSPFNWKVFRGKINPVLICVCSCPVVTLPHRASTAVNVKTLLGRLWRGWRWV